MTGKARKGTPVREWWVQGCLTPGVDCTPHRMERKVVGGRTYVEVWHCDRCIAREMMTTHDDARS